MRTDLVKQFLEVCNRWDLAHTDQKKGVPPPPLTDGVPRDQTTLDLPPVERVKVESIDLTTAIRERKSVRAYSDEPLTVDELAYLLWATQGVKSMGTIGVVRRTFRTVPSAASIHPFETYLLCNNVRGLARGIYRYEAMGHRLVPVDVENDLTDKIQAALYDQPAVKESCVTFFWVAVPDRMAWRYAEKAYPFVFIEAGHIAQNLSLAVQAIGAGCVVIGAIYDHLINAVLGFNPDERFVVYAASVGKPART